MRRLIILLLLLTAGAVHAHPGSGIAVSDDGVVYFVDTGAGLFSIERDGRVVRHEGQAFHWFAFDPQGRFRDMRWPAVPNGEFQSAGAAVLSSDFPVTIAPDGKFYYPEPGGGRVRIVAIDPSGTREVRATLPALQRHGQPITWINGLAPGPNGSLYYTEDRAIRRVDRQGRVSTIAANVAVPHCARIPSDEPLPGPYLRGLAVARDGSVYVAAAGCGAVLRVDARGNVKPILRATPPWSPTAIALHGSDIYVLEYLHTATDNRREWRPRVYKISGSGKISLVYESFR